GSRDLRRQIIAASLVALIVRPEHDQCGYGDVLEIFHHDSITLRQDAAAGERQPLGGPLILPGTVDLDAAAEALEAALFEAFCVADGEVIPAGSCFVFTIAWSGIAQDERAHHVRVRVLKFERDISAK